VELAHLSALRYGQGKATISHAGKWGNTPIKMDTEARLAIRFQKFDFKIGSACHLA
jgi:hypothetical protein